MSIPPTVPIRIVLVDDHTLMRAGLVTLIEQRAGLTVVGEAANQTEALAVVAGEQPDILLLDLDLRGESSLDVLPALRSAAPTARVIMLTGVRDPETHRRAIHQGAMGVVLKDQATEVLLKAIERVHAGEVWIDRAMMATILTERAPMPLRNEQPVDPAAEQIASLTAREREIIGLIAEGLKNKQIGERLFITETTVVHHLGSIYAKLGVKNRLELSAYAYRHGLAGLRSREKS